MSSIQDIIRKKQEEIAIRKAKSLRSIKPEQGRHQYRILPGWRVNEDGSRDPQFWHDWGQHFIKKDKDTKKPLAVYMCVERTYEDRECPVCAAVGHAVSSTDNPVLKDNYKESNSRQVYLLNVLHRSAPDAKLRNVPQVMEVGATIFEQICEYVQEYDDITDLNEGIDLIIKREGSGFDTTYTVLPAKKSAKVPPAILEQLNNLDAYTSQESKADLSKALTAFGMVSGMKSSTVKALASKTDAAALPAPETSSSIVDDDIDLDEDVDIDPLGSAEEVEDADVVSDEVAAAEDLEEELGDELDELDSLLDDLDLESTGTDG